jgi:hypothetical protein
MPRQVTLVKCPVCEGLGELSPRGLVDQFTNPNLRERLEARIAEVCQLLDSPDDESKGKVLNFQKEVHNWNPALAIWRRSSKE